MALNGLTNAGWTFTFANGFAPNIVSVSPGDESIPVNGRTTLALAVGARAKKAPGGIVNSEEWEFEAVFDGKDLPTLGEVTTLTGTAPMQDGDSTAFSFTGTGFVATRTTPSELADISDGEDEDLRYTFSWVWDNDGTPLAFTEAAV